MTDLCDTCQHMRKDSDFRKRCYSPQLVAMKTPGIICVFERDEHPEPDRSHQDGTGKCGPNAMNRQRGDFL